MTHSISQITILNTKDVFKFGRLLLGLQSLQNRRMFTVAKSYERGVFLGLLFSSVLKRSIANEQNESNKFLDMWANQVLGCSTFPTATRF